MYVYLFLKIMMILAQIWYITHLTGDQFLHFSLSALSTTSKIFKDKNLCDIDWKYFKIINLYFVKSE